MTSLIEARSNDAALRLIEGAIRMKEVDIEAAQTRLIDVIAAEKRAHENVEFWKAELNGLVAARQELERSLRALS